MEDKIMPKFRKKPVVIEAEQFHGKDPLPSGVQYGPLGSTKNPSEFFVMTLEGPLRVSNGDWIITGVKGEKYPCKPDIFEATYEPVDAK